LTNSKFQIFQRLWVYMSLHKIQRFKNTNLMILRQYSINIRNFKSVVSNIGNTNFNARFKQLLPKTTVDSQRLLPWRLDGWCIWPEVRSIDYSGECITIDVPRYIAQADVTVSCRNFGKRRLRQCYTRRSRNTNGGDTGRVIQPLFHFELPTLRSQPPSSPPPAPPR